MTFEATLNRILLERERANAFSGVVKITQDGQELFAGAYGYAHRSWGVRNDLGVRFETASLTKLFTAVAILQIIEQNKLSFETPAIPYLEITDSTISDAVTVYHLLTHTSGIADDADEEAGEDYADLWRERPNYMVTQTADFLPQFINKPPNFAPGAGCRYNNVAFVLLGLMLEKATGLSYRDYVRQHIFAPVGMAHSDFLHMADVHEDVAESYTAVKNSTDEITNWRRAIYARPPIGSPDGGAWTTAGDLDLFMTAVRNGRLLSPELTQAFLTPQVLYREHEDFDFYYGYALYFALNKGGEVQFYLGQGEDTGVSAKCVYFPAQNIQAVLLANQDSCTWPLVWELYELISAEE
jgi:CubicO group peptidase (beta-lactamase class C family)